MQIGICIINKSRQLHLQRFPWISARFPFNCSIDAVFLERTHFDTTNLRTWYFFGQETYIHFVTKLKINNVLIILVSLATKKDYQKIIKFLIKKVELDNAKIVFLLELVVIY